MSKALKLVCVLAATLLTTAGSVQGEDDKDIARMNAGAVTLITDGNDAHASRYATDLAVLMESERDLRILPVMGRGPVEALRDLLFLRGIDASIIPSDTVAYMRKQGLIEEIDKKVTYIARLGSAALHVIARKDIATIKDLAGKKINVGGASEARFVTASLVFEISRHPIHPRRGPGSGRGKTAQGRKSGRYRALVAAAFVRRRRPGARRRTSSFSMSPAMTKSVPSMRRRCSRPRAIRASPRRAASPRL